MYVVFEVYYKYGEYSVKKFATTAELVKYLGKYLYRYTENKEYKKIDCTNLQDEQVEAIIKLASDVGSDVLAKEQGYGIVSIVKGEIIS